MFTAGITAHILREYLAATAPVDLLGMRLLQAHPHPGLYPLVSDSDTRLPHETLKEAVSEIVDYTGRCAAAAQRLSHLAPIPVRCIQIVEFGL